MWLVILIIISIGAMAEVCLSKASRQHFLEGLSEQNNRFLEMSSWLTLGSLVGLLGVQFYYQGILMLMASFMQLVAGAFLMQHFLAKVNISRVLRLNLALLSGPVCVSLLMVVVQVYQQ